MTKREKEQIKRQVESAEKLLRSKRPRIDDQAAAPLIEFIHKNTKETNRPDWWPQANEEDLMIVRLKELTKPRQRPRRHPLGYSYEVPKDAYK